MFQLTKVTCIWRGSQFNRVLRTFCAVLLLFPCRKGETGRKDERHRGKTANRTKEIKFLMMAIEIDPSLTPDQTRPDQSGGLHPATKRTYRTGEIQEERRRGGEARARGKTRLATRN